MNKLSSIAALTLISLLLISFSMGIIFISTEQTRPNPDTHKQEGGVKNKSDKSFDSRTQTTDSKENTSVNESYQKFDSDGYSAEFEKKHSGVFNNSEDDNITEIIREYDGKDSDHDGVPNELEEKLGTNSSKTDTDEDGFTDYEELRRDDFVTGTDPNKKDIYVEMDVYTNNSNFPENLTETTIEKLFAEINVTAHVYIDEYLNKSYNYTSEPPVNEEGWDDKRAFYVLLVPEIGGERNIGGYWSGGVPVAVEHIDPDAWNKTQQSEWQWGAETNAMYIMHELGHALGIYNHSAGDNYMNSGYDPNIRVTKDGELLHSGTIFTQEQLETIDEKDGWSKPTRLYKRSCEVHCDEL